MSNKKDQVLYQECADWGSAKALTCALMLVHGSSRITQRRTSVYVDIALLPLLASAALGPATTLSVRDGSKLEVALHTQKQQTVAICELSSDAHRRRQARSKRMLADLEHAYHNAPNDVASSWAKDTVCRFGFSIANRVGRIAGLGVSILEYGGREILDFGAALVDGRVVDHISKRGMSASKSSLTAYRELTASAQQLIASFAADPGKVGPALMIGALAAYTSSGGLDGDGGAPDLDIALLGIDSHRSIFSHSILAGAVIETGLVSLIDLINRVHAYLPPDHDRLWDEIKKRSASIGQAASRGASVGIAYHLGIDGLVQPAAYHDLPFAAPLEVHQGILTVNAASEAGAAVAGPGIPGPKPAKQRDVAGIAAGVITTVAALLFWA